MVPLCTTVLLGYRRSWADNHPKLNETRTQNLTYELHSSPFPVSCCSVCAGRMPKADVEPIQGLAAVATSKVGACKSLRAANIPLKCIIDADFTCTELVAAGFAAMILKEEGFTCQQLYEAKVTPYQLQRCGFTSEMMLASGVTQAELDDLTKGASIGAEMKALNFMSKLKKRASEKTLDTAVSA